MSDLPNRVEPPKVAARPRDDLATARNMTQIIFLALTLWASIFLVGSLIF